EKLCNAGRIAALVPIPPLDAFLLQAVYLITIFHHCLDHAARLAPGTNRGHRMISEQVMVIIEPPALLHDGNRSPLQRFIGAKALDIHVPHGAWRKDSVGKKLGKLPWAKPLWSCTTEVRPRTVRGRICRQEKMRL